MTKTDPVWKRWLRLPSDIRRSVEVSLSREAEQHHKHADLTHVRKNSVGDQEFVRLQRALGSAKNVLATMLRYVEEQTGRAEAIRYEQRVANLRRRAAKIRRK